MTKRKYELSLMNVMLCLFVIFIHAASDTLSSADKLSWQYGVLLSIWRCCTCAVPGFIFLSAVKFSLGAKKEGFSYPRYVGGRIKRVWIPYAIAVAVYYAVYLWRGIMSFDAGDFLIRLFDGNMGSHFYFVVVIMQFYLLAPLWRGLLKKLSEPLLAVIAIVCALMLGQLFGQYLTDFIYIFYKGDIFPYADRVFTTYIFWWICGLAVGQRYDYIKGILRTNFVKIGVFFGITAVFNMFMCLMHFSGRQSIYWLESVHIFYTICAILFLLALSVRLSNTKLAKSKPAMLIDRSSYSIYLWHPLFLEGARMMLSKFSHSIVTTFAIELAVTFIGTISVCVGVSAVVNKLKKTYVSRK